jgi:esterase/lipase superfamily enzyme
VLRQTSPATQPQSIIQLTVFCLTIPLLLLLNGCSKPQLLLMPTPVIYTDAEVDPFRHLQRDQQSTRTEIFYATNRTPEFTKHGLEYGNSIDSTLHLGTASVQMGFPETTWSDLYKDSLTRERPTPLPVNVEETLRDATIDVSAISSHIVLNTEEINYFEKINATLDQANDKEIMVYVHGTKVDFANSAILTAEVDHFAGRDFVGIAFAWPSHQDILHYLFRTDVQRANASSTPLKELLILLAKYTTADQINILSYSAGGKVTSKALFELRQEYPNLTKKELKEKLRIGSVVFAAADIDVDIFLERITDISEVAEQVVLTISDSDNALQAAKKYMGGNFRAGSFEAEDIEEKFIEEHMLANVEIIDVSIGQESRGFDIVGHHYWYRHPWMSSDIIFLMRTDLGARRRALRATEHKNVWYLPDDYPEKIKAAAKTELDGQW